MSVRKRKMLVVDDVEINRAILATLFSDAYEVLEAENGREALEILHQYGIEIAIVLLDLVMPVMNGFEVLREMNRTRLITEVPVIMVTSESDDQKAITGYTLGVSEVVSKPFNKEIILRRVNNVVELYTHKQTLERELWEQRTLLEKQAERLRQSNQFVIDALSTTVEFRNLESGQHIKRIRTFVKTLLTKASAYYPLTPQEIEAIASASAMHDIGKIAIPDAILCKPGRLSPEEFEVMKTHTTQGCKILESLNYTQDRQYYTYCYQMCRHHHERWDGRGYPDGIKGDEISIWAQATALADVYDALVSKRVYKDALTHDTAVGMILRGECGAFNPVLLDCFVSVKDVLHEQMQAYGELPPADAIVV